MLYVKQSRDKLASINISLYVISLHENFYEPQAHRKILLAHCIVILKGNFY